MDSGVPPPSPLPGIGNPNNIIISNLPKPLTNDEKRYLLAVERGDLANVRRYVIATVYEQVIVPL